MVLPVLSLSSLRRWASTLATLVIAIGSCSRGERPSETAAIVPERVPDNAFAGRLSEAIPDTKAPTPENQLTDGGDCPSSMAAIEGDYCPEVRAVCLHWRDPPTSPFAHHRCDEFQKPVQCAKKRTPMRL